jgi:DNA-binding NarL/FixJ family response regulator
MFFWKIPLMSKLKIQLVDDHPAILLALPYLLEHSGYVVAAKATSAQEAIEQFKTIPIDAIILDLYMHPEPGEKVIQFHQEIGSKVPILLYTGTVDVERLRRCLNSGALGCLLKLSPMDELRQALQTVALEKKSYIDKSLLHELKKPFPPSKPSFKLSAREIEIARSIARSQTSKEISQHLRISEHTVNSYRARLMKKLKVSDSAGVTRYVLNKGLA